MRRASPQSLTLTYPVHSVLTKKESDALGRLADGKADQIDLDFIAATKKRLGCEAVHV